MGFLLRLLSCSAMLEFDQHSWSPITGSSQPPYSQWMFVCVSLIDVRLNLRHSSQNFLEWGHSIQLWERLHSSTCSVLILIRRRVDVVASFLRLTLPFGFFLKNIKQFETTDCAWLVLIFASCNVTISIINTGWDCLWRIYPYFEYILSFSSEAV